MKGIVFLHGSQDSGDGFKDWLDSTDPEFLNVLQQNGFIFRFPTAPKRPFDLNRGLMSNVWHNRFLFDIQAREDTEGIKESIQVIDAQINEFLTEGVSLNNIFVVGMSMGGHMAIQFLHNSSYGIEVAGVVALSSFVSRVSPLWNSLKVIDGEGRAPAPLLMIHGDMDKTTPLHWGCETSARLISYGTDVEFRIINNLGHDLNDKELSKILGWLIKEPKCFEVNTSFTGVFGGSYHGELLNGKKHGRGHMTYNYGERSGSIFDGIFHDDERSHGILRWNNGDIYVGTFKNNLYDGWGAYIKFDEKSSPVTGRFNQGRLWN